MSIVKRTKREENRIVLGNVFFVILLLSMIVLVFTHLLPNIEEIENTKKEVLASYEELNLAKREGISFDKFSRDIVGTGSELNVGNSYTKNLIKEINQDFYNENFKNNTEATYETFINKKVDEYKNIKNDDKGEITSKVLPYHGDNIDSGLTDFQFVNYIETIINNFNLVTKDPIGISSLTELEGYGLSSSDNSLDKGIYEIGLDLQLVGRKDSIVDFLYFVENVGKINIDPSNEQISINSKEYKPGDVFYNFSNKVLGNEKAEGYNIFNNQIIDIESISMKEYINSAEQESSGTDSLDGFLKSLKGAQGKQRFEVSLKLKFYAKGLPKYRANEVISNFKEKISSLSSKVNSLLEHKDTPINQRNKLTNIKVLLENIEKTLNEENKENDLNGKLQYLNSYVKVVEEYDLEVSKIKIGNTAK